MKLNLDISPDLVAVMAAEIKAGEGPSAPRCAKLATT